MLRRVRSAWLLAGLACGPSPGGEGSGETEGATESGPTTLGPLPVCGDGVIAGDELCDDGNDVPDDGCDACTLPPARELWSRVFDGPEHFFDYLYAVGFTPAGRLYVAGIQGRSDRTGDIALRKLDVDGTLLWERIVEGAPGKFDGASALTVLADGGVVVAGEIDGDFSVGTPWVRRYSADGDVVWTFTGSPLVGPNRLTGVAAVGDTIFVSGYEPRTEDLAQVVVRRLDAATGAEVWRRAYDHGDRSSVAEAAALDGDSLIVAGYQGVADGVDEAIVQRWGADGALLANWTWTAPEGTSTGANAVVVAPGGMIVVSAGDYFVGFAGDGAVQWTTHFEANWRIYSLRALTVDDSGRLLVTGSGEVSFGRLKGMLGVLNAGGGGLRWEILGGEEILSEFSGIAVHPSGYAVVGEICSHTTCDWWVRKYAPL